MRNGHHQAVQRVAIIGTSGAGRSTLGRNVADRLNVPTSSSTASSTSRTDRSCRRPSSSAACEIVDQPQWVVDGSYSAVRHVIWPRAECVIWLKRPSLLVTHRVWTLDLEFVVTPAGPTHGPQLGGLTRRTPKGRCRRSTAHGGAGTLLTV
jgi:hypothetical protein